MANPKYTMNERILRQGEVLKITGLSRQTLWRKANDGTFPSPVQITKNAIGWFLSDIEEWLSSLNYKIVKI